MLALVCSNLMFFMLLCWKIIYILEKLLGNILLLRKNAVKTFTESCNNPVELDKQMVEYKPIYLFISRDYRAFSDCRLPPSLHHWVIGKTWTDLQTSYHPAKINPHV